MIEKDDATFYVMAQECDECLFSPNRIVGPHRMGQLITGALKDDTHFICHKASQHDRNVCCRGFYDRYKGDVLVCRLAHALHNIVEVDWRTLEKVYKNGTDL